MNYLQIKYLLFLLKYTVIPYQEDHYFRQIILFSKRKTDTLTGALTQIYSKRGKTLKELTLTSEIWHRLRVQILKTNAELIHEAIMDNVAAQNAAILKCSKQNHGYIRMIWELGHFFVCNISLCRSLPNNWQKVTGIFSFFLSESLPPFSPQHEMWNRLF